MPVEAPKNIGKGEGGNRVAKLESVLQEYADKINELEQRVEELEGGTTS